MFPKWTRCAFYPWLLLWAQWLWACKIPTLKTYPPPHPVWLSLETEAIKVKWGYQGEGHRWPYKKRVCFPCSFHACTKRPWVFTAKGSDLQPRGRAQGRHYPCGALILAFQAPDLWQNKFLLYKPVVPNLLALGTCFMEDHFFTDPGVGDDWGWFKDIAFTVHFSSITIASTSPQVIRR